MCALKKTGPISVVAGPSPVSPALEMPGAVIPADVHTEDRAFDETQELRAVILAALPYPPLPVTLARLESGNRLGDGVLQSTHDIISNLLAHSCVTHTFSENKQRQQVQQLVLSEFLRALVRDGLQSPPDLYRTYCEFSRRHVATYLRGASVLPDIRFQPLDSVCKGDPVHVRMCDYMAAQGRLLELSSGLSPQDWACREYADMLTIARDRLVTEVDTCQANSDDGLD